MILKPFSIDEGNGKDESSSYSVSLYVSAISADFLKSYFESLPYTITLALLSSKCDYSGLSSDFKWPFLSGLWKSNAFELGTAVLASSPFKISDPSVAGSSASVAVANPVATNTSTAESVCKCWHGVVRLV